MKYFTQNIPPIVGWIVAFFFMTGVLAAICLVLLTIH